MPEKFYPNNASERHNKKISTALLGLVSLCTLFPPTQVKKTIASRNIPVRVSRHHECPNEGRTEAPRTSQHYHIEGFKGTAGLSNNECEFFAVWPCPFSSHCLYRAFRLVVRSSCIFFSSNNNFYWLK